MSSPGLMYQQEYLSICQSSHSLGFRDLTSKEPALRDRDEISSRYTRSRMINDINH